MPARKRQSPRAKNPLDWIGPILEGVAESEGAEDPSSVHVDMWLEEVVNEYMEAVDLAIAECSQVFPPDEPLDNDLDEVYADLYHTLAGSGVGIWDGRWDDQYNTRGRYDWKPLIECYRQKLGRFVDVTGGGALEDAMRDAVYRQVKQFKTADISEFEWDAEDFDTVQQYRRSLGMGPLDLEAAGWTDEDLALEAQRIRALQNPRDALLSYHPQDVSFRGARSRQR